VTSLGIAIALFILVKEDQGKEVDMEVPVVLSNTADNEVFVGELPRVLRVRIRDRWSRLARALERKANPYQIDLRGFSDDSIYVFDRERLQALLGVSGLSIQSVYPSEFEVRKEERIERVVPIRANLVGSIPEGYSISKDRIRVSPSETTVRGARSSVREVSELTTHPIELSALDKDARIEVQVQKPSYPFIVVDDERVRVDIQVAEIQGRVALSKLEIGVRSCPDYLICQVEPATVELSLSGPIPTLRQIEAGHVPVELFVDAVDLDPGVARHTRIRPSCDRPQGVTCDMSPRTVTLLITNPEDEKPQEGRKTTPKSR
jgi:hypothetical protein